MGKKLWKVARVSIDDPSEGTETQVAAENWMSALRLARTSMGDPGGVPPGSSCTVDGTGSVTVLDASARRRYRLTSHGAAPLSVAPPPSSVAPPPSSVAPPPSNAASSFIPPAPKAPSVPPPAASVPPPAASAPSRPPPAASAPPPAASAPPPSNAASSFIPPAPKAPSVPPPAASASELPAAPSEAPKAVEEQYGTFHGMRWTLLQRRDSERTEENPLTYRERAYAIPQGSAMALAEAFARDRITILQRSIHAPRGVFINVGVFDHEWSTQPSAPPLVAAAFKDWKPEIEIALTPSPSAPSSSPAPSSPPAPSPAAPAPDALPIPAAPDAPSVESVIIDHDALAATIDTASDELPIGEAIDGAITLNDDAAASDAAAAVVKASRESADIDRVADAFEACQDLLFLQSPIEALDFTNRLLAQLVPSDAFTGYVYDYNEDVFRSVVSSGPSAEQRRGRAIASKSGLFGAAMSQIATSLNVDQPAQDPRFFAEADGHDGLSALDSLLYIPLSLSGQTLGMLQLHNRSRIPSFTAEDVNVCVYVGQQLSEFLHSQKLRRR